MKCKIVLFVLYTLRILLCLSPQHGYLHPDEFFQFTEPFVGDFLDIKNLKTWEFKTYQPIRCIFFPFLLLSPLLLVHKYTNFIFNSYSLLVIPRLLFTLISFLSDFALYKICILTNCSDKTWPLLTYASSYLTLCYLTHTFTNSLEALLLAFILWILVFNLKNQRPSLNHATGCLLCLGFFNRPTFGCFAIVPSICWILADQKLKPIGHYIKLITSLIPSFLVTLVSMLILDTCYYRQQFVNNFVVS